MLLLLRTAALTGGATVGLNFGLSGVALTPAGIATVGIVGGLTGAAATASGATVDIVLGLSQVPPLTGVATLDLTHGLSGVGSNGSTTVAGPTDSRIADTAFRRKKKRRIEEIAKPGQPAQAIARLENHVPVRLSALGIKPDFRSLAELSGKSVEVFRTEVDQEIAQLMGELQERDDEDALTLILAALED